MLIGMAEAMPFHEDLWTLRSSINFPHPARVDSRGGCPHVGGGCVRRAKADPSTSLGMTSPKKVVEKRDILGSAGLSFLGGGQDVPGFTIFLEAGHATFAGGKKLYALYVFEDVDG